MSGLMHSLAGFALQRGHHLFLSPGGWTRMHSHQAVEQKQHAASTVHCACEAGCRCVMSTLQN